MKEAFAPYIRTEAGTAQHVLAQCYAAAGGVKEAAHLLGRSESSLYKSVLPDGERSLPYDDLRRLARAGFAHAAAQDLAGLCGGLFIARAGSRAGVTLAQVTAKKAELFGLFTSKMLGALADGKVDAREARDMLPECVKLLDLIAQSHVELLKLAQSGAADAQHVACLNIGGAA